MNGFLKGCTSVFLISDKAVFAGHYWETRAYEECAGITCKPNFKEQVTDAMVSGRQVNDHAVHDKFAGQADLFKNAKAIIMAGQVNELNPQTRHDDKLDLLETLKDLIPGVDIERVSYMSSDDGDYTEGNMKSIVPVEDVLEEPKTALRKEGGRNVYLYEELVHEVDQHGDKG